MSSLDRVDGGCESRRMTWILRALLVLAAATVVASCGAGPTPPRDEKVELFVSIQPDGSATADVFLNGMADSRTDRRAVGDRVAAALFPGVTSRQSTVTGDGLGSANVTVRAEGAYSTGSAPDLRLDTKGAIASLLGSGAESVDVLVSTPGVPTSVDWTPRPTSGRGTTDDPWAWQQVTSPDAAPSTTLQLRPQSWLGVLGVLVPVLAWAAVVVGCVALAKRRRRLAVGAGLVAVAAFAVVVVQPQVGALVDHLGVGGMLSGSPLEVARRSAASLLLAFVAGVAVVGFATRRARMQEG